MISFFCHKKQAGNSQQGIALVTSLILLVVLTLLGLTAIKNITQEERMAGHSYSRSLNFQAAEFALRTVEELVETYKPMPTAGCAVASDLLSCAPPASSDTPRWEDSSFTDWKNLSAIGSGTLAITPQYFVEYLGNTFPCDPGDTSSTETCKRYRITVRSSDKAVMLQSVYATE